MKHEGTEGYYLKLIEFHYKKMEEAKLALVKWVATQEKGKK